MLVRGHRRAAIFTVGVMVTTTLAYTLDQGCWSAGRGPEWQLEQALLSSKSFPSGHAASVTAFGGILIVLVVMLVRRGNMRRLLYVLIGLMIVVVCLDRVLLGRHFPSDVVGGFLLGMGMVASGWRSTARCRAATPSCCRTCPRRTPPTATSPSSSTRRRSRTSRSSARS